MAIYSASFNSTQPGSIANAPIASAQASAVNRFSLIDFAAIFLTQPTSVRLSLGRASSSSVIARPQYAYPDSVETSSSRSLTAFGTEWTTPPGAASQYFRSCTTAQSIGGGVLWSFPRGIQVQYSAEIVLWSPLAFATPTVLCNWVINE